MKTHTLLNKTLWMSVVVGVAAMGVPMLAGQAAEVPLSYVAEPGIYKVLAENDQFRVILATWKPGQRDAYHSHPANAAYRLTDCKNKVFKPDGSEARGGDVKAGTVLLQDPVVSHSFQNAGDKECQTLIVERK